MKTMTSILRLTCDRCCHVKECEYKGSSALLSSFIEELGWKNVLGKDICPDCIQALKVWLKGGRLSQKEDEMDGYIKSPGGFRE